MARRQASEVRESDIVGLKYFDRLMPLLKRLHEVGTQRDRAGNRQLFFDQYCAYILLFLFNPIVTSLRGIQQASELKKVQKKLGCPRVFAYPTLRAKNSEKMSISQRSARFARK
jgi:hypothetical protein